MRVGVFASAACLKQAAWEGIKGMVEAAGVEPASEAVVSREPTYVVAFTPGLRPTFASRGQNATRNAIG